MSWHSFLGLEPKMPPLTSAEFDALVTSVQANCARGNWSAALPDAKRTVAAARDARHDGLPDALVELAIIYHKLDDTRQAQRTATEALDKLLAAASSAHIASQIGVTAQILFAVGEEERALTAIERALEMNQVEGSVNRAPLLFIFGNMVSGYGDHELALEIFARVLELSRDRTEPQFRGYEARAYSGIVTTHAAAGNYEQAVAAFAVADRAYVAYFGEEDHETQSLRDEMRAYTAEHGPVSR